VDPALLHELESALLGADIGVATTREILASLRQQVNEHKLVAAADLKREIKKHIVRTLETPESGRRRGRGRSAAGDFHRRRERRGQDHHDREAGASLQAGKAVGGLAAGDTFRAAAIEQLEVWARRAQVELIKQKPGADPAAVVFDALSSAKARAADVVIVDTAGRLHTKSNLMAELEKMKRTASKAGCRRAA
jgi:fused signal recognition particle receptor